jgi:non-specific serine/threonine protein kinase/serine/threonine-protein kinase
MSKENQDRDAIVARAMGIASEQKRAAYIVQACGDNAGLKQQVEEQVAARSQGGGREKPDRTTDTGTPSPEQNGANHAEDRELRIPRLGSYKVMKQIGEGAAGIVFEAEQQEPVPLKVALKIIKHGLDWRQVVARFEAERQVLARMDHPNIAKVIGAGTHQSGQPYFVVELVEGLPLTKYCDEHQQSLQQRLELFLSVCQAVQYAHQKGIIHGDLKLSNVLVSSQENKPAPKVLDFGVAKAVRRKPSENAGSGGPGDKPEYRSPEQADPNDPDIDTRSDVYSLGVLLYELVTGTTPLTPERLKDASTTETLRLIREEEAPPPSTRLNESKDRLASVAAKRQMKPEALVKAVQGDLDCVVMKALQKDRTRRYETVNELARDLQRYLAKEPVEACPHSTRSQLRTVARKHPRAAMTVVGILLFLLAAAAAGAGLTVWEWRKAGQAQKAEQEAVEKQEKSEKDAEKLKSQLRRTRDDEKVRIKERDRAQEAEKAARRSEQELKGVMDFIKNKLLSAGRPRDVSLTEAFWAGSQGKDVTVNKNVTLRQAVDLAESQVAPVFADRPLGEAAIREMLGMAYLDLGDASQAVKQYERAFALRKAVQGDKHPETADVRNQLAVAYRLAGHTPEASRLYHRNPDSPAHASALAIDGSLLLSQKKPAEAEMKLRECLTIRQRIQPDDWTTFETKSLLGEALLEQKKYADAEPLLLSGYEGMKRHEAKIPPADKARLTKALQRLVQLYEAWNKKDKADQWRKELEAVKDSKKP